MRRTSGTHSTTSTMEQQHHKLVLAGPGYSSPRTDSANPPPHPLLYASLEPCYLAGYLAGYDHMGLHKPKTKYTIGRGPLNDFVLDDSESGQIDWTHCTLMLLDDGDVRIEDNHTTNGIWVANRRLHPGESCVLKDGDSVRFGKCVLEPCKQHDIRLGYVPGQDCSYVFRSYISRPPSGLSACDQSLREQLENVERRRADIVAERMRLEQELKNIEEESERIIQSMPALPPTKAANIEKITQSHYESLARYLRDDYPDFFPKDVRDFRPQPWLAPVVGPDSPTLLHEMHRSFGAIPNEQPPPLEKDSCIYHFTRAMHDENAPDWNHPEVTWGELQALNLSTPLMVPPSIIFWSIEYCLPVYMHPNFLEASRKGPYAHPYAISEDVFSDESAAIYRAQLGIPPLENPRPLRPVKALNYRIEDYWTVADEDELAEWVALLQSERARDALCPSELPVSKDERPSRLVDAPSKRRRESDADECHLSVGHASISPTGVAGQVPDESGSEHDSPRHLPSTGPAGSFPPSEDPLSANTGSESTPAIASRPQAAQLAKRRKISHTSTANPTHPAVSCTFTKPSIDDSG
ncbi:hypothetical protein PENSPDRAFT_210356 [Peniophora sp. CONT]|nr:hypothetical protein PENSPDRAFT_210356 [Peniophora sp. CONT]